MSPSTGQYLNCLCCLAPVTTPAEPQFMMHVEMPDHWCLTDGVQQQYSHKILLTVLVILLHCRSYSLCPAPACLV